MTCCRFNAFEKFECAARRKEKQLRVILKTYLFALNLNFPYKFFSFLTDWTFKLISYFSLIFFRHFLLFRLTQSVFLAEKIEMKNPKGSQLSFAIFICFKSATEPLEFFSLSNFQVYPNNFSVFLGVRRRFTLALLLDFLI